MSAAWPSAGRSTTWPRSTPPAPRAEELVLASQQLGVLSRFTSLLVLESDQAYQDYKIERRKAAEQERLAAATPTVTGGDLDSLGARGEASL